MSFRQRVSLESICSLIADCPHSTPFWTDEGHLVIRNQNIKNGKLDLSERSYTDHKHYLIRIRRAKPQFGDLIFTREAPMGDVCMVPEGLECCVGQRQVLLRPNPEKVVPRFLLYAIQSPEVQHEISWSEGTGSTVSNVRIPVLKSIKIPLLPLEEQKEVAALLGALDDRITLLRETNATLEAIAQALFKSWFVDFDPVRAKQEGRAPECMDEATAALFPDGFEESELGAVPRGWSLSTLGSICNAHSGVIQTGPFGSQLHASDYVSDGIPVVMPKDIAGRRINCDSAAKIRIEDADRLSRHQVQEGDIVFSRRGDVEKHALIGRDERGWLCGTGCLLVRPGRLWRSPGFLSRSLELAQTKRWLTQHAVGATMPNLNTGILAAVPVLLPDGKVLSSFEEITSVLDQRISENNATAQTLSNLRDTLLPRLISGQLRLSEAEAMLETAA